MKSIVFRWALVVAAPALLVVIAGSGPPATAQSSASVSINNFAFSPQAVSVSTGGTVTWQNNQMGVMHTVTADDGSFDAGILSSGQTFVMTFSTAGTIKYHCDIHPSMHGSVQVMAAMVASTQPQAAASLAPSTAASPVTAAPSASTSPVAAAPSASASPVTAAPSASAPSVGTTRNFAAGFDLISIPAGSTVNAAAIDDFDPVANTFRTLGSGEQPQAGHGYWAFFNAASSTMLAAGSNQPVSITDANGSWILIGNPSGTQPALVTGASAVFSYDSVQGKYNATMLLAPGDGAWAMAPAGGVITIAPGATAPTPTPSPTPSPMPVSTPAPIQQPRPAITPAPANPQPNPNPYPGGYFLPMPHM